MWKSQEPDLLPIRKRSRSGCNFRKSQKMSSQWEEPTCYRQPPCLLDPAAPWATPTSHDCVSADVSRRIDQRQRCRCPLVGYRRGRENTDSAPGSSITKEVWKMGYLKNAAFEMWYVTIPFFMYEFAPNKAKRYSMWRATKKKTETCRNSGMLKEWIDIPLQRRKIIGWRETCTRQGVQRDTGIALSLASQHRQDESK